MRVEYLNISHNPLSGRIPETLSSMVSLGSIDFSYNNLMGPIPTGNIFQQAPAKAFVGNSGLCGKAEGFSPSCAVLPPDKAANNMKKVLIGAIVSVSCLLCLATIIIGILAYGQTVKLQDAEAVKKYETLERMIWEREKIYVCGYTERY